MNKIDELAAKMREAAATGCLVVPPATPCKDDPYFVRCQHLLIIDPRTEMRVVFSRMLDPTAGRRSEQLTLAFVDHDPQNGCRLIEPNWVIVNLLLESLYGTRDVALVHGDGKTFQWLVLCGLGMKFRKSREAAAAESPPK